MALWKLSAHAIASGIRERSFSCEEVMRSVLERVAAVNPRLNAITVDLSDSALAEARRADDRYSRGDPVGPLHGVPVTIKENVDMVGHATNNGVAGYQHMIASEDAPLVENLKRAGAIVIGRTNTPEFSMRATTDNPLRGRTLNPWDEQASPGGSSGGAGAAAAAGMGPLHHGNDIGGSLRFPSFANGVVTVKPTNFRIPVYNSSAPDERGPMAQLMSVQGVIAREAEDVALATRAMIAPDARDPNCPPVPFDGPALESPITVAVCSDSHGYPIDDRIVALIDRAAEQLADAGYRVVRVSTPSIAEAAGEWFRVGTTDLLQTLGPEVDKHGSDTIRQIFVWLEKHSHVLERDEFILGQAYRTRLMRQWNRFLEEHPLVLAPFMMRPLYTWNYDAESEANFDDLFDASIWSTGINYLGLPAGVVGMDLVDEWPAAVQLIGRRYREDTICEAMGAIQSRNGVLTDRLWARDGD